MASDCLRTLPMKRRSWLPAGRSKARAHGEDSPATSQESDALAAAQHDTEQQETRTLVASAGRLVRAEFEQSLLEWASELGVQCKVFEHPHLLKTQVGFTVTGSKRKLDEFAQGLKAEERAVFRTERTVMLSPL
jgi:hypothetical protein